jgi:hypothetical protein
LESLVVRLDGTVQPKLRVPLYDPRRENPDDQFERGKGELVRMPSLSAEGVAELVGRLSSPSPVLGALFVAFGHLGR